MLLSISLARVYAKRTGLGINLQECACSGVSLYVEAMEFEALTATSISIIRGSGESVS